MGERRNALRGKDTHVLVMWRENYGPQGEVACRSLEDLRAEIIRHRLLRSTGALAADTNFVGWDFRVGTCKILYDDSEGVNEIGMAHT